MHADQERILRATERALRVLEEFADDPVWLRKRTEAFIKDRWAYAPPTFLPALTDWLYIDDNWTHGVAQSVDGHPLEVDAPLLDVPRACSQTCQRRMLPHDDRSGSYSGRRLSRRDGPPPSRRLPVSRPRRLDLSACLAADKTGPTRRGMFLDIESTGLDTSRSEPLEIAILPFDFTSDGAVIAVHPALHQLNEPSEPIPSEITAITGLTDEIVAGHHIDPELVSAFVDGASLIVAHNASFDRPFAERITPVFADKAWACSMCDVPWRDEGMEGRRLADLLARYGLFFDAHRAVDDCEAGVALLSMKLPRSGKRVLDMLLHTARGSTWRIFAVDAPFECREILKRRGYRWNTNRDFGPRCWWVDVNDTHVEAERTYLEHEIFRRSVQLPMKEITAYQRYATQSR